MRKIYNISDGDKFHRKKLSGEGGGGWKEKEKEGEGKREKKTKWIFGGRMFQQREWTTSNVLDEHMASEFMGQKGQCDWSRKSPGRAMQDQCRDTRGSLTQELRELSCCAMWSHWSAFSRGVPWCVRDSSSLTQNARLGID